MSRRFRQPHGDFGVLPVGLVAAGTAGSEVPLHGIFPTALLELSAEGREIVFCGDWNIAHQEIDLKNWRNKKNSGFLPEERAWLTRVFEKSAGSMFTRHRPARGAVHLVEQPRPGLGQERRLAHRLPDRHAWHRCAGAADRSTRTSGFPITLRSIIDYSVYREEGRREESEGGD